MNYTREKIIIGILILLLCTTKVNAKPISDTIIHAGGSINGKVYTNSKQALKQTLSKDGVKVVEMDFMYTSDNKLVCLHSWNDLNLKKPITYKKFMKKTIKGYTTLSAYKALKMLAASDNTYLVLDTKEENVAVVYKEIDDICKSLGKSGKQLRKRIIPQIYQETEYEAVRKIYKYKNWIFTMYKQKDKSQLKTYKKIAKFCKEKKIGCVTIPKKYVTKSVVKVFNDKNINTATHTVNSVEEKNTYFDIGVNTIYTDFLY